MILKVVCLDKTKRTLRRGISVILNWSSVFEDVYLVENSILTCYLGHFKIVTFGYLVVI